MGQDNRKPEKVSQSSGSTNPRGSTSQDNFRSIVVAVSSDHLLADNLKSVLQKYGIKVMNIPNAAGDDKIQKLLVHIENKVNGAILICSNDLTNFLDNVENKGNISLEINGANFDLNGVELRKAIEAIENIGKKIILLSFAEAGQPFAKAPSCLSTASPVDTFELKGGKITQRMLIDSGVDVKVYGRLREIVCKGNM